MQEGLRDSTFKRRLQILWVIAATILLSGLPETLRADFVDRVIKDESGEHRYTVFLPEDYSADKKWPVILYLHGAGERGNDGKRQLTIGLAPAIEKRKATFPFIAIFPQCEDTSARYLAGWLANGPDAQRALKQSSRLPVAVQILPKSSSTFRSGRFTARTMQPFVLLNPVARLPLYVRQEQNPAIPKFPVASTTSRISSTTLMR